MDPANVTKTAPAGAPPAANHNPSKSGTHRINRAGLLRAALANPMLTWSEILSGYGCDAANIEEEIEDP